MSKEVLFGDVARNKLGKGVRVLADAVRVTMGPRGRNVLLQKPFGDPVITKDGVSVAQEIKLPDTIENMGVQVVKQAASKTADEAGDGTTTATVLAHAVFTEGLRNVTAGSNPVILKRGMDKARIAILKELKNMTKPIENKSEIAQIATISANSDEVIGNIIAEAMESVGKHGVITVDKSKNLEDELVVVEGLKFDQGFTSPYFINNEEKNCVEYEDANVYITDKKIQKFEEINHIVAHAANNGQPMIIIADDFEDDVLANIVSVRVRSNLKIAAVKAPGYGNLKADLLRDISTVTGAVFVSKDIKIDTDDLTSSTDDVEQNKSLGIHKDSKIIDIESLGIIGKVIIDKNNTTIIDGGGKKENIESRIKTLQNIIENSESAYETASLQERIAKLSGGIAVIKVGAGSDVEMKEKIDRYDDALSATRSAVEEGIVIGGGAAIIKAAKNAKLDLNLNGDELTGAEIVFRAIKAPIKQIAANAGYDAGVVVSKVEESEDAYIGFDASTGEYVNMFEAGIIDPYKVERVALTNAVSVASLLLTTESTVTILPAQNGDLTNTANQAGLI